MNLGAILFALLLFEGSEVMTSTNIIAALYVFALAAFLVGACILLTVGIANTSRDPRGARPGIPSTGHHRERHEQLTHNSSGALAACEQIGRLPWRLRPDSREGGHRTTRVRTSAGGNPSRECRMIWIGIDARKRVHQAWP